MFTKDGKCAKAAASLVVEVVKLKLDYVRLSVDGLSLSDIPLGNWEITVKKLKRRTEQ